MAAQVVDGRQRQLVLGHVLQQLVVAHQPALIIQLVRQVELQPVLQPRIGALLGLVVRLLVHAQEEVAAGQVHVHRLVRADHFLHLLQRLHSPFVVAHVELAVRQPLPVIQRRLVDRQHVLGRAEFSIGGTAVTEKQRRTSSNAAAPEKSRSAMNCSSFAWFLADSLVVAVVVVAALAFAVAAVGLERENAALARDSSYARISYALTR